MTSANADHPRVRVGSAGGEVVSIVSDSGYYD
jgi:hypothetical protein